MRLITTYEKAWADYKKTKGYKTTSAILRKLGIKNPYLDNILREPFDAGWNTQSNNHHA